MRRLLDVAARGPRPDRHQGGLWRRGVRRVHGAARRGAGRFVPRAGLPGGWRGDRTVEGLAPRSGRARPPPAGLPPDRRRPVRHLHAGHADGRPRLSRRRRADRTTTRSARRSRATCVAARATPRSSRPSRSPPPAASTEGSPDEPGRRSHRGPDQRPRPPPGRRRPRRRPVRPRRRPNRTTFRPTRSWPRRSRRPGSPSGSGSSRRWSCCSPAGRAGADRAAESMPVEPPVTSPLDLADAYAALAEAPTRPIAGGTDLMVALTGELGEPPARILDLWRLDELRGIAVDGDAVTIGALTTYTEIRRSSVCREHLPVLVEAAATIGAAQIQNRGTLGGNIANASPAGDTLPVLLAADASFVLGSGRGERTVAARDFWPAYRRTALAPDELLLRIRIPLLAGREMRFRKVGTRRAQSISKVVMASAGATAGSGHRCRRPARGRTSGWRSGRWRPRPSVPPPRRRCSRDARRPRRPPISRPRPSPPSSSRSTTSARPPSTAGSSRRASCIGSSARRAAGDDGRPSLARTRRGAAGVPVDRRPRRHRAGRLRRRRRAAVRGRARVPRPAGDGPAVRYGRGDVRHGPDDRPRDAARRADRADRRAPAARRAAGRRVGPVLRRAGLRRGDSAKTAAIAATPPRRAARAGRGARPVERRVRGTVRVPLLRLRRRPVPRRAAARDARGPRGRPGGRAPPRPGCGRRHRPRPVCHADGHGHGCPRGGTA